MDAAGRKHPPHFPVIERHNIPIIISLTVCTKNRMPVLANDDCHKLLRETWQTRPTWLAGRYCIMPDHIHLFCAPADLLTQPLEKWVRFWKSGVSRCWPHLRDTPIWQRHFWDTQLRRGESYTEKWDYIMQNPVRAGLVAQAEDWPYQGELNILQW